MLERQCFGKHLPLPSLLSFLLGFPDDLGFALLFSKSFHTHSEIPPPSCWLSEASRQAGGFPSITNEGTKRALRDHRASWVTGWKLHSSQTVCLPPNPDTKTCGFDLLNIFQLCPLLFFPTSLGLARVLRVSCLDHYTSLAYLIWVICDTSSFHYLTPPSLYRENHFALWSLKSPYMIGYSHHLPNPTPLVLHCL